MTRSRAHVSTALIVSALLVCGCGSDDADRRPVRLLAGAGLRPAVQDLVAAFEKETGIVVEADYGGSGVIVGRVKMGAEADLVLPGDQSYLDGIDAMIASRTPVTWFVPTIIVAKGNPKDIRSLTDFARDDVTVALGNPQSCRIGQISDPLFRKHGLEPTAVDDSRLMLSTTVNELGIWVKTGQVDAAVVWEAIAANVADSVDCVKIPPDRNVISKVAIGVLASSRRTGAAAKFVEFLQGPTARKILADRGYHVSDPSGRGGG